MREGSLHAMSIIFTWLLLCERTLDVHLPDSTSYELPACWLACSFEAWVRCFSDFSEVSNANSFAPAPVLQSLTVNPSAGRPSLAGFAGQAIRPLMATFLFAKKDKQMGHLKARCSDF